MTSLFGTHKPDTISDTSSVHSLPMIVRFLLSVLGGAMMFAAFPPLDWDVCIWVGLMPLLSALWIGKKQLGKRGFPRCFLMGWIFGLVYYGGSFWWINEVSTLGFIPLTMFLSLYPALWAGVMGTWLRPKWLPVPECNLDRAARLEKWKKWCFSDMKSTVAVAVAGAALWVCTEWLRGWIFTGFGWNSLGVGLYKGLSFAQWAEYVGVTALSFIPAMAAIWLWCVGRRLGMMLLREGRRTVPWDFFVLVLILIMLFLGGMVISVRYAPNDSDEKNLPVLALQQNHSQSYKWNVRNAGAIYEELAQSTLDACLKLKDDSICRAAEFGEGRLDQPTWVIWPESSFPTTTAYSFETGELLFEEQDNEVFLSKDGFMGSVRDECGGDFVVLTGSDEIYWNRESKPGKIYNTLSAFEGDFSTKKSYAKNHLVPFGEYIPFRDVFPLLEKAFEFSAGSSMGSNFTSGGVFEPFELPYSPGSKEMIGVIPTVCFEDTVGRLTRKFTRSQAQVIVNVTNDGWFNKSWANEQHWRNAAFRCIELRRSMIRAANTGLTLALGPNGGVISELRGDDGSPFIKGYVFARLPVEFEGLTLYAMAGDWAVAVCFAVAMIFIWRRVSDKKEKNVRQVSRE